MKNSIQLITIFALIGFTTTLFAVDPDPPRSTDPARLQQELTDRPQSYQIPDSGPLFTAPEQEKELIDDDTVSFVLEDVIINGVTVYSKEELYSLYADFIDQTVLLGDLQNIAQAITNKYQEDGYILSSAIIPPQRITDGVATVQVFEGYVSEITIEGNGARLAPGLHIYGEKIKASRPLRIDVLERYLLLANDLSGVKVRTVLSPAAEIGSSHLTMLVDSRMMNGYASADNFGTRYIGPKQGGASATFNQLFNSRSDTSARITITDDGQELEYTAITHNQYIGSTGAKLSVTASNTRSQPDFSSSSSLRTLKIEGNSTAVNVALSYPIIRSRQKNFYATLKFDYLNSETLSSGNVLFNDRIRSLRFNLAYDFNDSWQGHNTMDIELSKGIGILNPTPRHNPNASRGAGTDGVGRPDYAKLTGHISREQWFTPKVSFLLSAKGQRTLFNNALLSSEEFGVGGNQYGRGYDSSEITGDSGLAGKAELRYSTFPEWKYLPVKYLQLYSFYDAGIIWQVDTTIEDRASLVSAGLGTKMSIGKHLFVQLEWAKPLTRKVSAQANGKAPRIFFNVVAYL